MLIPRKPVDEEASGGIPGWNTPSESDRSTDPVEDHETQDNSPEKSMVGALISISTGDTSQQADVCCPGIEDLFDPTFFKALSDPNRVAILAQLARMGRPCTVTELSACCPRDLSVVSRHLASMKDAGVVRSERKGKQVYYWVRVIDVAERMQGIAVSLADLANRYRDIEDRVVAEG